MAENVLDEAGCRQGVYKREFIQLVQLTWPISAVLFLEYSMMVVATIVCGHLGKTELETVALATSIINVTGVSIIIGWATGYDTLFTQIFGSGNMKLLRVVLIKG